MNEIENALHARSELGACDYLSIKKMLAVQRRNSGLLVHQAEAAAHDPVG
jgi:hypothetical protein